MRRTLLAIIMSALAAGGMSLAHHDEHGKGGILLESLISIQASLVVDTASRCALHQGTALLQMNHPGVAVITLDGT
jgi:hypothetical protein